MNYQNFADEIVTHAPTLALQARQLFDEWKSGQFYIPRPALRAMGRRYMALRDKPTLTMIELFEFGRLYGFFALVYPEGLELPSPSAVAVDFCNLFSTGLPIGETLSVGEGVQ